MNHYAQRGGSLNTSQRPEYDYNVSPLDGRARYGPLSNVKPQSLPSRPVDPQGEHALPRKYPESFSNVGSKATNAAPSTSATSDLEILRALKKKIMDGQLPGYDAIPKPQALEALYTPRVDSTTRTNAHPADTYHKSEINHTLEGPNAPTAAGAPAPPIISQISAQQAQDTTSTTPLPKQEISVSNQFNNDLARSPIADSPGTLTPIENPPQSVTIPQTAHETHASSPTSMIMSPTEPRLVHRSSVTDMELDSPPPSAAPTPAQEDSRSNGGTGQGGKPDSSTRSGQVDQDLSSRSESSPSKQSDQAPTLSNPRSEKAPESGFPLATGTLHGQRTYPDDSRRQEDPRHSEYRSQQPYATDRRSGIGQNELAERLGTRSPESSPQRNYRRASYPDPRRELPGPPRSPNDGRRYDYYEPSSRFLSNRSPPPSSFPESRGYDLRAEDSGRVVSREPYPGPPGDRSSASARNLLYDREPSRSRDSADERRQPSLSETSDGRALDHQRRVSERHSTLPPLDPSHPMTSNVLQSRTPEDGRYFYSTPPPSSLPAGPSRSLPAESNPGTTHVKTETPDDGNIGRRSTTPRSVGEPASTRPSSFIPGRVPDGLPSRPPPSMKEPLTPRSSLMPDRIAPEPRQPLPLAARLTSPNDYVQRGARSGPPPNSTRPVDGRRPIDETRYSSPTDRESWSESGRIEDPFRREPSYSRPDDARDYRIVPRAEWERSRSPQSDRYGPPMSSRSSVPPSGYPYQRERSLSPPRRSGAYPRPGYPDIDDTRGSKRPRQELMDPDYRRPPPLDWRLRDEYDPRVPPPPRPAFADPRAPYTRPPPPDTYRSYDREPYPPDNRPRPPPPPYGNERDRYPSDPEWSGRPPYRR
ncbi:hypothetical protein FRC01_000019 [Tulasnella sp. 417]|nr:hypothetical protein FRC01_000019 [Tulasnella sp. 417]